MTRGKGEVSVLLAYFELPDGTTVEALANDIREFPFLDTTLLQYGRAFVAFDPDQSRATSKLRPQWYLSLETQRFVICNSVMKYLENHGATNVTIVDLTKSITPCA